MSDLPDDETLAKWRKRKEEHLADVDRRAQYVYERWILGETGERESLALWCEMFGLTPPARFREYDPTDEDRRMLAEMGIEA
jgi:hypothetical protein